MPTHIIVGLELTPPAKKALHALTDKLGMTQVAMLSRLVEWVARQPARVQASILGQLPSAVSVDTARLMLEQMAAGKKA
ncbi:MAG: hypothetical protein ACHRHE_04535 [Tepidisphaerales bacterium]